MGQADERDVPGQIGRYEIRRRIGAGGMGVVYAAFDPELERDVAVKLLRSERVRNLEAASQRLRREAQTTAKLAHPNVVTIYDVGRHGETVYVAMELVEGPSLLQWMHQVARPWREVTRMFFQAGLGLAAAHDAGLVHRDFKPANVLVGSNRARVVDFGLARAGSAVRTGTPDDTADVEATAPSASGRARVLDVMSTSHSQELAITQTGDVTRTGGPEDTLVTGAVADVVSTGPVRVGESLLGVTQGSVGPSTENPDVTATDVFVGTPAYMAPELFTGGPADTRSDQFAFCVSLYEGLYGERPFAGDTPSAIADNVLNHNVRPAPSRSRVPGWVRSIVVRGLAVNPEQRHPSIKSLLASVAFTARIMFE